MPLPTVISFQGWTLQRDSGELSRGSEKIRLAQQPLRVLLELLEHPGQVVRRERLVELLWPKGVVDFDASLNAAVRKLRVSLGDDSETPQYIETLPRIGYRFIGTIDQEPEPTAEPVSNIDGAPAQGVPRRPITQTYIVVSLLALVIVAAVWLLWPHPAPPEPDATTPPRRTTNERAYEHYLAGIFHRSRRDISGSEPSIAEFEAALREDPHYADAWAGLAETLVGAGIAQHRPVVRCMLDAKAAAMRAVEIDPANAAGYAALGMVHLQFEHDFKRAEEAFVRASAENPNYARAWHHLGVLRAYQGRAQDAIEAMRRARELEPTMPLYAANFANLLYHARRYDEAIEHVKPLLSVQPRFDQARSVLIRALVAKGDAKAALDQLALRVSEAPTLSDAGLVYAHLGRREDALQEIARIERRGAQGFGVAYEIAVVQAALGDLPAACRALMQAYDDHSQALGWMALDPRMDPLREQPCFSDMSRRLMEPK